jgi:hypothetical protein
MVGSARKRACLFWFRSRTSTTTRTGIPHLKLELRMRQAERELAGQAQASHTRMVRDRQSTSPARVGAGRYSPAPRVGVER